MAIIKRITKHAVDIVNTAVEATGTQNVLSNVVSKVVDAGVAVGAINQISPEDLEARRKICYWCPNLEIFNGHVRQGTPGVDFPDLNSFTAKCNLCGCQYAGKLRIKSESCPAGKWGPVS